MLQPEALFRHTKSKKKTYEERLASIEKGREGREKFGNKREKERGSKTNEVPFLLSSLPLYFLVSLLFTSLIVVILVADISSLSFFS